MPCGAITSIKWEFWNHPKRKSYDVVARILGENVEGILSCMDKVISFPSMKKSGPKLNLGTVKLKKGDSIACSWK